MKRRRLLRILLTALAVLLFTGYFAFSSLLFSPLEGDYEYDIASLIPRDVDFYFSKADLRKDFDPLPRPKFADAFEASKAGQVIQGFPSYASFLASLEIEETMALVDQNLANLPVKVEPLKLFGGRDLAVAGYVREEGTTEWAALGRCNWMGKLGYSLLRFPNLLGLDAQGITVHQASTEYGEVTGIAGGQLAQPMYLNRVRDVLIVGTEAELVGATSKLESARGENSFGQSAKYGDNIGLLEREGNELEAFVDHRALLRLGMQSRWPDPTSESFMPAFLGKLFQAGSIRELTGMVKFLNGLTVNLTGALSSENMSPLQKRLYRTRGFDRARVRDFASWVPADAGLFLMVNGNIGDYLREAYSSTGEALQSNLSDLVRDVWGHADVNPLIDDLTTAFHDRIIFVMRDNDYPPDTSEKAPPNDGQPTHVWAVILNIKEAQKVGEIGQRIQARQDAFGIQGPEPGSRGVFENTDRATGARGYEYFNPLIPGTGHIATLEDGDIFMISNSFQMLGHMRDCYLGGRSARLADFAGFGPLLAAGLPSTNLLVWLNPREVSDTNRDIAKLRAEYNITSTIDWNFHRRRIEESILKQHFDGRSLDSLSTEEEEQLAIFYDEEADAFANEYRDEKTPELRGEYERMLTAWEITAGTLVQLSITQKKLEVFARCAIPLD